MTVRIRTAHSGLEVASQVGRARSATARQPQSMGVILKSDFFIHERRATKLVMRADSPIGHAPMPAPSESCAKKTVKVTMLQMTQERTCGLVSPRTIERIYG